MPITIALVLLDCLVEKDGGRELFQPSTNKY